MAIFTILYSCLPAYTFSQPPRATPRPTDQRSGELRDPALTAFLGTPNDDTDIDFSPVPIASDP